MVRDRLSKIRKTDKTWATNATRIKRFLLKLSQCDKVVQESLGLLVQMHSFEDNLFLHCTHCQLLDAKDSEDTYERIKELLPDLHRWFGLDCNEDDQVKMVKNLDSLAELCTLPGDEDPHKENQLLLYNFGDQEYLFTVLFLTSLLIYRSSF